MHYTSYMLLWIENSSNNLTISSIVCGTCLVKRYSCCLTGLKSHHKLFCFPSFMYINIVFRHIWYILSFVLFDIFIYQDFVYERILEYLDLFMNNLKWYDDLSWWLPSNTITTFAPHLNSSGLQRKLFQMTAYSFFDHIIL